MDTAPIGNRAGSERLPGLALNRDIATGEKVEERWASCAAARQEADSLGNQLFGWGGPKNPRELGG